MQRIDSVFTDIGYVHRPYVVLALKTDFVAIAGKALAVRVCAYVYLCVPG